jgi:rfaE bifunctional protein kinase chain/domain
MDFKKIKKCLKKIRSKNPKILVIGDIMLDHYVSGDVSRISPEAPVPIIQFKKDKNILGGAGNVAHNLINLFANVDIATIIGSDKEGQVITELLEKIKIPNTFVLRQNNISTTKKTRFLSNGSQLLRLDNDSVGFKKQNFLKLEEKILPLIKDFDSVIISDYDKGVCEKFFIQNIIAEANKTGVLTFIDPKGDNWGKYYNATCITPNVKEVESELKLKLINDNDFKKAGEILIKKFKLHSCLITRGPEGMTYVNNKKTIHQKVSKKEVYDVSGAGDAVIACLSLCLSSDFEVSEALELSSVISSEVVMHLGTTPFTDKMLNIKL